MVPIEEARQVHPSLFTFVDLKCHREKWWQKGTIEIQSKNPNAKRMIELSTSCQHKAAVHRRKEKIQSPDPMKRGARELDKFNSTASVEDPSPLVLQVEVATAP